LEQGAELKSTAINFSSDRFFVESDYAYLNDLAPLFAVISRSFMPATHAAQRTQWKNLEGELTNIKFDFDAGKDVFFLHNANIKFKKLSIPQIANELFVKGINGDFNFAKNEGHFSINSQDLLYEDLALYRKAITFDDVQLVGDIKRSESWSFNTETVKLSNDDISIEGYVDGELLKQKEANKKEQSLYLDMQLSLDSKSGDRLKPYYPVKVLDDKLVDWLETKLSGGKLSKANILLKGNLDDYPFRNKKGKFLSTFQITGMKMDYHPDWPSLTMHKADVRFENEGVWVKGQAIESGALGTFPVEGSIADFKKNVLVLDFNSSLDLRNSNQWLKQTPLYENLQGALDNLDYTGSGDFDMHLELPLKDINSSTVDGKMTLSGNQMDIKDFPDSVYSLQGDVYFTHKDIRANGIKAIFKDQAVIADLKQTEIATEISVNTEADFGNLKIVMWVSSILILRATC